MAVCQNPVPLVNIKIAGKCMFIPPKHGNTIGIDPYPYSQRSTRSEHVCFTGCFSMEADSLQEVYFFGKYQEQIIVIKEMFPLWMLVSQLSLFTDVGSPLSLLSDGELYVPDVPSEY